MPQNISKYVQINDFLLLEYEFNRDGETLDLSSLGATVATTTAGYKQYFNTNKNNSLGVTNNILELNSVATNSQRSNWFNNYVDITQFSDYFDSSLAVPGVTYQHDTVKVHVISGYNFDDIAGFLLQVGAEDSSLKKVDLSNFTYIKQPEILGGDDVVHFSQNALFLGNKFYDKYIEFKIPSVYALGNDTQGGFDTSLGQYLNIKPLSDVYVTYSTVPTIQSGSLSSDNVYTLVEEVDLQLPVTSTADRFNAFIAESTEGDYIEYYATFDDQIIGQFMGDIESGRIALYTSNNPNDNYQEFSDTYGTEAAKWVLIHELFVYEHFGNSTILTQKFSFTQDSNFSLANYFRPVLQNADIDSSFTIQYICRLTNRMDGSQIIRKASFSSTDPKKYGLQFTRINVDNIIPYKVFNRIDETQPNIMQTGLKPQTKYVKVFYDTTEVIFNQNNEIYPQGTGPLMLRNGDSVYKFKFERINESSNNRENVDLSGAYNYALLFVLDDDTTIETGPTYSTNMNTTIGELEFKLSKTQIDTLLNQTNKVYSIVVKNPNGTSYNFYEGQYYSYNKRQEQQSQIQSYIQQITTLNKQISKLQASNKKIQDQYNALLEQNSQQSQSQDDVQQTGLTDGVRTSEDTSRRPTAGPNAGIVGRRKPQKVKPAKEIDELARRVKTLEEENVVLTKKNITLESQQPAVQKPRYPSKDRPRPDREAPRQL
jgi:hypothetical protein